VLHSALLLPLLVTLAAGEGADAGFAQAEAIAALKREPWPQRLAAAAGGFLGARYLVSPLGEGEGPDPDPLLRFDAFDCLTLVEASLALGLAPDEASLLPTLSGIRYQGSPAWNHRLHVMESQWLPAQLASGRLIDVTRVYGGDATRRVVKVITARTWQAPLGRSLHLEPADQTVGRYPLELIPAARAVQALAGAPSGLVVVVVRADSASLVTRITHTAVLLRTPAGPALRHASKRKGRVVDEPLADFLRRSLAFGAWTVEGLAVYEPRGP
jgi:hypothetical protein